MKKTQRTYWPAAVGASLLISCDLPASDEGTSAPAEEASAPAEYDTPEEEAAALACAALGDGLMVPLPDSEAFEFASYPAVFQADFATADYVKSIGPSGVDYWCHQVAGVDGDWQPLNSHSFADDEGNLETYIVTQGIDAVIYFGTNETPADLPGDPAIPGTVTDVSSICPGLPSVWAPAWPEGQVHRTPVVCMHHAETTATIAFVQP